MAMYQSVLVYLGYCLLFSDSKGKIYRATRNIENLGLIFNIENSTETLLGISVNIYKAVAHGNMGEIVGMRK